VKVVVLKEIKELVRDPRILISVVIVPLIIFPLMGSAFSLASETMQKEIMKLKIALIDEDNSTYSHILHDMLKSMNNVVLITINSSNWIKEILTENVKVVIRIPKGFMHNLTIGVPGTLDAYLIIKSLSMSEGGVQNVIENILREYAKTISITMIHHYAPNVNASTILNPVIVLSKTIIKGNVTSISPQNFISAAMNQTMMMPIIIMILIMIAAQVATTSIAVEKEEKTLETLLTLPVKRVTILWGKLIGSAVVALAGVIAYMIGFTHYMNTISVKWQPSELSGMYMINIPFEGYAVLAASLFFSLMSALALAVLLGAYTQDVRSAHSLLGILYIPVFIPAFILMFADMSALPLSVQAILYAIPFSHPMIAAKAIILGDFLLPLIGVFYNMAFMVITLYVAAKFFKSEKIVIARITFRRGGVRRGKNVTLL